MRGPGAWRISAIAATIVWGVAAPAANSMAIETLPADEEVARSVGIFLDVDPDGSVKDLKAFFDEDADGFSNVIFCGRVKRHAADSYRWFILQGRKTGGSICDGMRINFPEFGRRIVLEERRNEHCHDFIYVAPHDVPDIMTRRRTRLTHEFYRDFPYCTPSEEQLSIYDRENTEIEKNLESGQEFCSRHLGESGLCLRQVDTSTYLKEKLNDHVSDFLEEPHHINFESMVSFRLEDDEIYKGLTCGEIMWGDTTEMSEGHQWYVVFWTWMVTARSFYVMEKPALEPRSVVQEFFPGCIEAVRRNP